MYTTELDIRGNDEKSMHFLCVAAINNLEPGKTSGDPSRAYTVYPATQIFMMLTDGTLSSAKASSYSIYL